MQQLDKKPSLSARLAGKDLIGFDTKNWAAESGVDAPAQDRIASVTAKSGGKPPATIS